MAEEVKVTPEQAIETLKQEDLTKERNLRCFPAAAEILKVLARAEVTDKNDSETFAKFTPLYQEIMQIMMANNIKLSEVSYLFRLTNQPFLILQELTTKSLNKHMEALTSSFWGKSEQLVTVAEMDAKLKALK